MTEPRHGAGSSAQSPRGFRPASVHCIHCTAAFQHNSHRQLCECCWQLKTCLRIRSQHTSAATQTTRLSAHSIIQPQHIQHTQHRAIQGFPNVPCVGPKHALHTIPPPNVIHSQSQQEVDVAGSNALSAPPAAYTVYAAVLSTAVFECQEEGAVSQEGHSNNSNALADFEALFGYKASGCPQSHLKHHRGRP